MGRQHRTAGALAGVAGVLVARRYGIDLGPWREVGAVALAAIAGLAPDLDHPDAKLSRVWCMRPVSAVASRLGHRGATHSVLAATGAGAAAATLGVWAGAAVAAGWASHLVLDVVTGRGCPLLWPVSRRRIRVLGLKTGGRVECLAVAPVLRAALLVALVYAVCGALASAHPVLAPLGSMHPVAYGVLGVLRWMLALRREHRRQAWARKRTAGGRIVFGSRFA